MKPTFYFVGCSGTACDGLPESERSTKGWPALVCNVHNANFINDGIPGGANDAILSRLMQNINKFDRYYVQWTFPQRFSLTDSLTWEEVNFSERMRHTSYNKKDYYTVFGKYFYTYWASPLFLFKGMLEKVVLAQSLLKVNNLPYIMVCSDPKSWNLFVTDNETTFIENVAATHNIKNLSDDLILKERASIQQLVSQIDFERFIKPTIFFMADHFNNAQADDTGHPAEDGNKYIASRILALENF